jgi:hypothetical protein
MGAYPAKEQGTLKYVEDVEVSREDYDRCYTKETIVLMDECIQELYDVGGHSRYLPRAFRNLALFFLSPLIKNPPFEATSASPAEIERVKASCIVYAFSRVADNASRYHLARC